MGNRIKDYYAAIEKLIANPSVDVDYGLIISEHLIQIGFFMHERLIHLMVTITFALITVISILYTMIYPSVLMFVLIVFLFILLIPYLKHYYLLENTVQKMYKQYDELVKINQNRKCQYD